MYLYCRLDLLKGSISRKQENWCHWANRILWIAQGVLETMAVKVDWWTMLSGTSRQNHGIDTESSYPYLGVVSMLYHWSIFLVLHYFGIIRSRSRNFGKEDWKNEILERGGQKKGCSKSCVFRCFFSIKWLQYYCRKGLLQLRNPKYYFGDFFSNTLGLFYFKENNRLKSQNDIIKNSWQVTC